MTDTKKYYYEDVYTVVNFMETCKVLGIHTEMVVSNSDYHGSYIEPHVFNLARATLQEWKQ